MNLENSLILSAEITSLMRFSAMLIYEAGKVLAIMEPRYFVIYPGYSIMDSWMTRWTGRIIDTTDMKIIKIREGFTY